MRTVSRFGVIIVFVILAPGFSLHAQTPRSALAGSQPIESEHTKGPHGLEGWTLNWPLLDAKDTSERYAFTLVVSRNGRILRIDGHPFIWKWMFWSDGRQVAYETGPLHFSMSCVLADAETGRQLAAFDCEYQDLPKNAPDWLQALVDKQ